MHRLNLIAHWECIPAMIYIWTKPIRVWWKGLGNDW